MKHQKKLGELAATAICGNDITSSCLYVSSLTILYAGQYARLARLMVAVSAALLKVTSWLFFAAELYFCSYQLFSSYAI